METVAVMSSLLVALLGVLGIASPERLLGIVRRFQSPLGIYTVGILRLVFGLALFLAAPASRAPDTLRVVGVFIMLAGAVTPLFGVDRFRRILAWWSSMGPGVLRAWGGFAALFGLLLAYALLP